MKYFVFVGLLLGQNFAYANLSFETKAQDSVQEILKQTSDESRSMLKNCQTVASTGEEVKKGSKGAYCCRKINRASRIICATGLRFACERKPGCYWGC